MKNFKIKFSNDDGNERIRRSNNKNSSETATKDFFEVTEEHLSEYEYENSYGNKPSFKQWLTKQYGLQEGQTLRLKNLVLGFKAGNLDLSYSVIENCTHATFENTDLTGATITNTKIKSLKGTIAKGTSFNHCVFSPLNDKVPTAKVVLSQTTFTNCLFFDLDSSTAIKKSKPQYSVFLRKDKRNSITEIKNLDFSGLKLTPNYLKNITTLENLDLRNTDLSAFGSFKGITFKNCKFDENTKFAPKANFDDAQFPGCQFERCNFKSHNMRNANFSEASFSYCLFDDVDLTEANLRGIQCQNTLFKFSLLNKADLSNATIEHVEMRQVELGNAKFHNATAEYFTLLASTAKFSQMNNLTLMYSTWNNTDLTGCNFEKASIKESTITHCDMTATHLPKTSLISTTITDTDLKKMQIQNACISGDNRFINCDEIPECENLGITITQEDKQPKSRGLLTQISKVEKTIVDHYRCSMTPYFLNIFAAVRMIADKGIQDTKSEKSITYFNCSTHAGFVEWLKELEPYKNENQQSQTPFLEHIERVEKALSEAKKLFTDVSEEIFFQQFLLNFHHIQAKEQRYEQEIANKTKIFIKSTELVNIKEPKGEKYKNDVCNKKEKLCSTEIQISETIGSRPNQEDAYIFGVAKDEILNVPVFLQQSFAKVSKICKDDKKTGTTACVTHVDPTTKRITVANIADSPAILFKRNTKTNEVSSIRLSKDQKPEDPLEKAVITKNGGKVVNNRVNGGLAVPRAFGDSNFQVTSEPDISEYDYNNDKDQLILVVGCDGLFDGKTNEIYLSKVIENYYKADESYRKTHTLADTLRNFAYSQKANDNSSDNITVLVVENLHLLKEKLILGVLDGHGGPETSKKAANVMKQELCKGEEKKLEIGGLPNIKEKKEGEVLDLSNFTQTMSGNGSTDLPPSINILTNEEAGQLLRYPESMGNLNGGDFNNTVSQYFLNNSYAKKNLEESLLQQISSLQVSGRNNSSKQKPNENFLQIIIQSQKENEPKSFAQEEAKKNEQIIQNILDKFMKTDLVIQLNLVDANAFQLGFSCAIALSSMSTDISNLKTFNIVIDTTTDYLIKCSNTQVEKNELKEKVREELGRITKEELELNKQNQK